MTLTPLKSNVSPHHTAEKSWKMSMMSMTPMRMPVTCLETQVSLFSFLFLYFTNNYLLRTLQLTTVTSTIARCSSKERPTTPALEGGDWAWEPETAVARDASAASRLEPQVFQVIYSFKFFTLLYTSLFVKSTQIILLNLDFK